MPAPSSSAHRAAVTIIREYNADPSRAAAALVRLLEKCSAAVRTGGGAEMEGRDGARPSQ